MTLRLLVVASETPDEQDARRRSVGESSDESYATTLRAILDGADIHHASCVSGDTSAAARGLARFDGVFFAGSPIQMHEETADTRSAAAFMREVFASGVPAFGSCAGLQIAAVAAGGACKTRERGMEAGFARNIVATETGRRHPMLHGRPFSWSAPALHSSLVDVLPVGAVKLAEAKGTPIEAAEIRLGDGVFWGVQYHPEISLREIAASLRRQGEDLVEEGFAASERDLDAFAGKLDALDAAPERRDLAWQLGLDEEVLDPQRRTREIRNALRFMQDRALTRAAA